jgi:hypothetical protein
VNVIGTK